MNVTRAYSFGVRADDCKVRSHSRDLGGAWRVFYSDYPEDVFLTADLYAAVQWVAALRRLERSYN